MKTEMETKKGTKLEGMNVERVSWKRNLIGLNLHMHLQKCEAHRDAGDESRRQQCNIHTKVEYIGI